MKKFLATAGAIGALSGICNVALAADNKDDSLTWYGITLYGTYDIGYTYQNRGTPANDYFPTTLEYMVQKNANRQISSVSGNGLSISKIGLKGDVPLHGYGDFRAVFKLETGFNPISGDLADGPKSMAQNNGIPLAQQTTNGDSSHAGQAFNRGAFAGVASKTWGTVTVGRQTNLLMDNIGKYDILSGANAFSFLGYSGTSGGGGDTQDGRWDNSVKYENQIDMFRVRAMFANGSNSNSGNGLGAALGADPLPGLSVDATFVSRKNEIAGGALSSIAPCTSTAALNAVNCLPSGLSSASTIAGTVSDNFTYELAATYAFDKLKFSGAYENIHWRNPQVPLGAAWDPAVNGKVMVANDIGGYQMVVNNNAYPQNNKIWQYMWFGARYSATEHLNLFAAWYYILQNQYRHGAGIVCHGGNFNTTSSAETASCSGREAGYSLVADYTFNKHFDIYAGAMYSHLADGLAAGSLTTFSIDPTIGGRFNF